MNNQSFGAQEYHELQIFDPSGIENLKETLGSEAAPEVIEGFFTLVEENIEKSLAALENKDYEDFEKCCHKIKSNVAYLGGKKLHKICVDIENFYVEENFSAIENLAEDFKTCCHETVSELKKAI